MHSSKDISEGKQVAIIGYITFVGALIALFMHQDNKTKFGAFHLRQAIAIHLLQISLAIVLGWFDSILIFAAFWVGLIVLWVYGFIGAAQGTYRLIPILGSKSQQWFNGIVPDPKD